MSNILLACFFLSGFSSLVYETLWTRSLTHVIGGSPYAVSIILTVFMGGLGLGGWLGGKAADRLGAPGNLLMAYGILEGGIGLYALTLSSILALARPAFAACYRGLSGNAFGYNLAVFLLCALLLAVPIACMGATLPLMGRFQARNPARIGGSLGFLYGLNTLGAAAGVFATGFWLFPILGLRGATLLAAVLNGAVGAYCALTGYRARNIPSPPSRPPPRLQPPAGGTVPPASGAPASGAPADPGAPWASGLALAAFGVSGFCAMAYEVIWTKVLGLVMGPTPYAFTSVLVTFITGLALGGWAFARLSDRARNPVALLALTQGAAALLALAASQRMGNSLFLFEKVDFLFNARFGWSLAVKELFLAGFMLLPTLFLGAAFPLVMRIFTREGSRSGDRLGRSIGGAYAVNTLGGVLGSWCAGFLLVPLLGSERSLGILAGLQAASALALYACAPGPAPGPARSPGTARIGGPGHRRWVPGLGRVAALGGAAVIAILCIQYPSWHWEELSRASSRLLTPEHGEASWWQALWNQVPANPYLGKKEQIFYGDGIGGFTSVWSTSDPLGNRELSLYISGKADASTHGDMFTQVLLAHVPMLLHPRPRDVMVLGLASGVTAGEAAYYPVDRLDILEINPQVVRASARFEAWNGKVLGNPKARLILQDAKSHLLLGGRKYDVIISEPSNPWMAGLAELFSREFLQRARDGLNEGGVIVQFLHSYQMDWESFALMGRTFAEVFPDGMLMRTMPDDRAQPGQSSDYLLVGRKGGGPFRFRNDPEKLAALARSRNLILPDVRLFYRLVEADNLGELFGPGPVHADDKPLLEFSAPRLRFTYDSRAIEAEIIRRRSLGAEIHAQADSLKGTWEGRMGFAAFAFSIFKPFPGMVDLATAAPAQRQEYAARLQAYCTDNFLPDLGFLEEGEMRTFCSAVQMASLNRKLKSGLPPGEIYMAMANVCMQNNLPGKAMVYYQKAMEASGEGSNVGRIAHFEMDRARNRLGLGEGFPPPH